MNQELVLVIIGLAVAALVLRPLLRRRAPSADPVARRARESQPAPSDELAELELDHAMGRVSDADYARWREERTPGAVSEALADDAPSQTDDVAGAEALVAKWRNSPRPRCPKCGERPEPEARFCSNCGAALKD